MLDMSPEELREHVRRIRADRKVHKDRPATLKKRKVASDKERNSLTKALGKLSDEQLQALLKGLGDDTDGSESKAS